ncbi:MAG: DUF2971 domain-containing protein [Aestuariivirga sp.]
MPTLYKYLSVKSAFAVLNNRKLRWSSPKVLNDPFDVKLGMALNFDQERVVDLTCEMICNRFTENRPTKNLVGHLLEFMKSRGVSLTASEVREEFESAAQESLGVLRLNFVAFNSELVDGLANSKLLCLSADALSILMWSHYSESHKGLLLEFSSPEDLDSSFRLARPVNYLNSPPNFTSDHKLAAVLSGEEDFDIGEAIELLVYSKLKDWAYESEWRIYSGDGRNPQAPYEDIGFHPNELKSVTFGLESSRENVAEWMLLSKRINSEVSFYQVEINGTGLSRRLLGS